MTHDASALREPWATLPQQRTAAAFGMWLFLGSEMLFFGAFFLAYAYLRTLHPDDFALASSHTAIGIGTANTLILFTSSLTMVLAHRAASIELRRLAGLLLTATLALGVCFLVLKGFEYRKDIADGLVPGANFPLPPAAQLFFGFYWIVTVVHVIHLSIGIVAVGRLSWLTWRDTLPLRSPQFEMTALYWSLVDVVWIVLYPLIYLGGRAA